MPHTATSPSDPPALVVKRGVCHALFAYEAGFSIDLDRAQEHITTLKERASIRHKRRTPSYFEYRPPPLRVMLDAQPVTVGPRQTATSIDALVYDFGAISVRYTIELEGGFDDLIALSEALYENERLLADSRRRVDRIVADIHPAISRPRIASFVEPYAIFQIEELATPVSPATLLANRALELAQVLRSERTPLSREEVNDAVAQRISFRPDDLTLIDWDAALVFDRDADDIRNVLEYANVELLEMRFLDQRLDDALDESYERLSRRPFGFWQMPGSARATLRRIGQLQVENAVLFEGVNNALKLLGDQYLARVYRLVSERFHLAEWDASILRKIQTLESIYQKVADQAANRRTEVLEWIIIVLIAAEIVLPFLPRLAHVR